MDNDKTRYRLASSIKNLMAEMPLDKITVKDIVTGCDLTRQTFYRNFKDKYDLVNWYFEKLVQQSFEEMGVSLTLREGLTKKFQFIRDERVFFACAFGSNDYNSLVKYDYEYILRFYRKILTEKLKMPLEDDVEFLLRMYCQGSIQMTVEWVRTGMKNEPEKMADLLIEALPEKLNSLLSFLRK
ncbi:TetR/AcrR family transcriptional regulator C-terminal domain-containing protein [Clostridium sp. AM58-1XD]|uniref:TetR/AcrR family transcriptional regulator C-terminal domain-containing protein n=1 Tax=Clostridium sp. AM58-1XD TaxID=2292307 RepID=UPI000E4D5ACE|nr:TetR/AcrR family transcriptional regulator C-terminal domain-containing protein [Clostridium sp. AM58-1XD]RGZ00702.1 TetR family transcriptional regulator [Clostridium sp. AM58-1XD]